MSVSDYFNIHLHYEKVYGKQIVVLQENGEFLEIYGLRNPKDGKVTNLTLFSTVCELCGLAQGEKHMIFQGDYDMPYEVVISGCKDFTLDKHVTALNNAGITVIVYLQDEKIPGQPITRSLDRIYSPGTILNDQPNQITNNIICIWLHKYIYRGEYKIMIGVARVNIFTGDSSLFEQKFSYLPNTPAIFDDIERILSIYVPNEIILLHNFDIDDEFETNKAFFLQHHSQQSQNQLVHVISIFNCEPPIAVEKAKKCESQVFQNQIIAQHFHGQNQNHHTMFNTHAMATQTYCFLLNFLTEHNPHLVKKIELPIFENCLKQLHLANHSLKQLNIIEDTSIPGIIGGSKLASVQNFLNECRTTMGKRQFRESILHPTTDVDLLNRTYSEIQNYIDFQEFSPVRNIFTQYDVFDIEKIGRKLVTTPNKIGPNVIYQLGESLKTLHLLIARPFHQTRYHFDDHLVQFITQTFSLQACSKSDKPFVEFNIFNRGIDSELDLLDDQLKNSVSQLTAIYHFLNELLIGGGGQQQTVTVASLKKRGTGTSSKKKTPVVPESMDIANDDNNTDNNNPFNIQSIPTCTSSTNWIYLASSTKRGIWLELTKKRSDVLLEKLASMSGNQIQLSYKDIYGVDVYFQLPVGDISFRNTGSGEKVFVDSSLITSLYQTIGQQQFHLRHRVNLLFRQFIQVLDKDWTPHIVCAANILKEIDVVSTKAHLAHKYKYCRPQILAASDTDASYVKFKGLRHALIEHINTTETFVTNDIDLGNHQPQQGILLYGTNAVGKTSIIRAIGIAVILAQAGMFVPAQSMQYFPYKQIFTRIVGNDNLFKGMSTFAVEMSELNTILRMRDQSSLILGDELCSGTETDSALGIFVASLEDLYRANSTFIFATHFHEIVTWNEIAKMDRLKLKHLSVIFDPSTGKLIYNRKLQDGSGESTYGLEVCKSLRLRCDVIDRAFELREKYSNTTNVLANMHKSHYNAKKLVGGMCEKCGLFPGKEVHHIQHQASADSDGFIYRDGYAPMHKNNLANLITLCESCHHAEHHHDHSSRHNQ